MLTTLLHLSSSHSHRISCTFCTSLILHVLLNTSHHFGQYIPSHSLRETWWLWVVWIIYAILGTIVLIKLLDHIKLVRNYKREQKEKQDPSSIDLDSINFEELFAEEDEEKKITQPI